MRFFDDVSEQTALLIQKIQGKCPACGTSLESRSINKPTFTHLDCPKCHLRIEVTTRNNERFLFFGLGALYAFVIGLAIGSALF